MDKLIVFLVVVGTVSLVHWFFGSDTAFAFLTGLVAISIADYMTDNSRARAYKRGRMDGLMEARDILKDYKR